MVHSVLSPRLLGLFVIARHQWTQTRTTHSQPVWMHDVPIVCNRIKAIIQCEIKVRHVLRWKQHLFPSSPHHIASDAMLDPSIQSVRVWNYRIRQMQRWTRYANICVGLDRNNQQVPKLNPKPQIRYRLWWTHSSNQVRSTRTCCTHCCRLTATISFHRMPITHDGNSSEALTIFSAASAPTRHPWPIKTQHEMTYWDDVSVSSTKERRKDNEE